MKHPELLEGELFLGYYSRGLIKNYTSWKTKRVGVLVIDENGKPLSNKGSEAPVFVMIKELEEDGMDIDWYLSPELNPLERALNGLE
ncbi:MAG: hypothetical protein ABH830_01555 [Patescibacteria group bacterium]